jgi:hypothetical protein
MLEEAICEGYKHMWLELTVATPDGRKTVLSMDPTAAQFGSAQPIVIWHSNNPEPGKHYRPYFKESTKGAIKASPASPQHDGRHFFKWVTQEVLLT